MVNELRELMREATDRPPQDTADLHALVRTGRRRLRLRRATQVGASALAAGAIGMASGMASTSWVNPSPPDLASAGVPRAEGPTIRLSEASPAVEGEHYRELTSYTNEDLESDNGEYFDGVTDDGLILFREAQTMTRREARFALMDPATGEKEWLPDSPGAGNQSWAVELSTERLVLMRFETSDDASSQTGMARRPVLDVYDRAAAAWRTIGWPTLPANDSPSFVQIGPDGRAYVALVSDPGNVPEGGWPMGPDGEADDSDAEGEVRALWSMSLTEPADARDEGMQVGAFAFDDDDRLVWTDSTNGAAGRVHVRDLDSGEETSFDPGLGERCNLLGFDVAGGRIAMSQYCGTYDDGVRDDRVQVVTTEGEPVITVQDSGAEGGDWVAGGDFYTVTAYDRATAGMYVYDFEEERLLRLSEGHSPWSAGQGPTPGDHLMWTTPAGSKHPEFGRSGAPVHLGELLR
jgi:hypothetical protein